MSTLSQTVEQIVREGAQKNRLRAARANAIGACRHLLPTDKAGVVQC